MTDDVFSFPLPKNDDRACSGIVDEAMIYAEKGKLGNSVTISDGRVWFEDSARRLFPMLADAPAPRAGANGGSTGDDGARAVGQAELPEPEPYTGPRFDILDYYLSPDYAGARTLGEAITLRGRRAFFDEVEPEDFSETPEGVERVGIATLWSQSTWSGGSGRDEKDERTASALGEGDVLVASVLPPNLEFRVGENWGEIRDWGFGFFTPKRTLLPFTPFHDYDLDLFLDALLTLDSGQAIVCVVRDSTCNGEDDAFEDEGFSWRVYSCTVTVLRVSCP